MNKQLNELLDIIEKQYLGNIDLALTTLKKNAPVKGLTGERKRPPNPLGLSFMIYLQVYNYIHYKVLLPGPGTPLTKEKIGVIRALDYVKKNCNCEYNDIDGKSGKITPNRTNYLIWVDEHPTITNL